MIANFVSIPTARIVEKNLTLAMKSDQHLPLTMDNAKAPKKISMLKRAENVKRGRGRPNLTWEESVKRDLKDWSITKNSHG